MDPVNNTPSVQKEGFAAPATEAHDQGHAPKKSSIKTPSCLTDAVNYLKKQTALDSMATLKKSAARSAHASAIVERELGEAEEPQAQPTDKPLDCTTPPKTPARVRDRTVLGKTGRSLLGNSFEDI